nr:hypothetical protein [uncultured Cellulosilyticum sp.]
MPDINRTRLVNTKYNDGNNYYEDFVLKLGGAHTLIDMINGLGKTFFLQCMAQPMLPNAKFKQEFPISLLFDKNNNNNTIHSLVEWRLDEGSAYKYALVGFCAYKKETGDKTLEGFVDEENQGEFGTFLYICYYNTPNAYDIESLPLVTYKDDGTRKVMNYKELEKYLKTLQGTPLKDYAIVINRTKKDHLKELAKLNINSVEWKHLMGINASEANAEKYLRSYTTASSFIQDFLIPTIEESYRLRHEMDYQTEENRAKTLLQLRQTLVTLQQKEALEEEYLYIENACEAIFEQLGILEIHFREKTNLLKRLSVLNQTIKIAKKNSTLEKEILNQELTRIQTAIQSCEEKTRQLEITERAYGIKEAVEALAELERLANVSKQEMLDKENAIHALEDKVTYYEGEKLYREYLTYSEKKALKEEEREARSKEHSELVADYSYWANVYGNRLLTKFESQENEEQTAKAELDTLKKLKDELNLKQERLKTEQHYYKTQLEEKQIALANEKEILSLLQKQFKHLTKEQLKEHLNTDKNTYEALQKEIALLQEELKRVDTLQNENYVRHSLLVSKHDHMKEKITDLEEKVHEANKAQIEIERLRDTYHTYELLTYFNQTLTNLRTTIAKKNLKLEELQKKQEAIIEDKGINLSKSAIGQFERIKDVYPSAILGLTFLEGQSLEAKERLLKQTNLLPYSILVDHLDFQKLCLDIDLMRDLEDELLPIIDRQALLSEQPFSIAGLTFTAKDYEFFMNVQLKEKVLKKLKKEELRYIQELKDFEGQIEVLEQHRSLYMELMRAFPADKIKVQESMLTEANGEKANLILLLDASELERTQLSHQKETLTSKLETSLAKGAVLEDEIKSLEKEWESLLTWEVHEETRIQLSEIVHTLEVTCAQLYLELENLTLELNVLESKYLEADRLHRVLFEGLIKLRMQLSAFKFEIEKATKYDEPTISFEEVHAKYAFYEKRLTEEASDVKLLDAVIKELTDAMKQKEKEMCAKHKDFDPEYFASRQLLQGDYLEFLNLLALEIQRETHLYEGLKQKATLARENFVSHEGALNNMKDQFKQTYGINYDTVFLQEGNVKTHLERIISERVENMQAHKAFEKDFAEAERQKNACDVQLFKLVDMSQKLDALIYKHQLTLIPVSEELVELDYFKVAEQDASKVLGLLSQELKAYEDLLHEVLAKLEAPELVHFKGDLDKLLTEKPQDELSALRYKELIGGKGGYLENLREEKERIKLTILELKKDEESFITQCIQKCEQVYNDLMSLSQLSKIELYGRSQEMIRIIVTPLDEELRFAKMRSYINSLVEQVEYIEESKKQAYLASHLTLRELFSAFVVNIKKSDVRIFKVEDIAENSRELPWNRAIGSTGQSNGMYMSIFICLISYIRKLYNPHIGEDSRKFIMLDSPFSGTAAAYIWEPVIKLLDRNNVQLLCVGYDIPNHLMSLFDVKYNLSSTYDVDKKQTIVVENIRSNMNLNNLSYDKLIGEQLTL